MNRPLILLFAPLCLLAACGLGRADAPSVPANDPDAAIVAGKAPLLGLQLTLSTPKTQYEQGEPIQVTMRYAYTGTRPLSVLVVTYDRSGRIADFGFTARNEQGQPVPDPTPFRGGIGGGLRTNTPLTPAKPYTQTATINEWLRFDHPGRYALTAHSSIVRFDDDKTGESGPPIPLDSAPLAIEITPPDDAHRLARLAQDKSDLDSKNQDTRVKAARDLRFMVDPRAIPLLMQALNDPGAAFEANFGLRAFPDMAPVKAALLAWINDDAHFVPPSRMWSYLSLLIEADMQASATPVNPVGPEYDRIARPYEALFQAKLERQIKRLSPARAAEMTVEGLAMGQMLSASDPANWKRILDNAPAMTPDSQDYAASILDSAVTMPRSFPGLAALKTLLPELRQDAADARLSGRLRSSALVVLHALGRDPLRGLVAADLQSPHPVFTYAAHWTLGNYQSQVIGQSLLRLLQSPQEDVRQSAAERLRDFGAGVSPAQLRALWPLVQDNFEARNALLEAIALKSPTEALPLIEADLRRPNRTYMGISDTAIRLVSRMRGAAAHRILADLLASPNAQNRQTVAQALEESWTYAHQDQGQSQAEQSVRRSLPPAPDVALSFFPQLLNLFENDSSGEVRAAARQALVSITGIPQNGGGQATAAQEREWLPQWQAWWDKNRARFSPEKASPASLSEPIPARSSRLFPAREG